MASNRLRVWVPHLLATNASCAYTSSILLTHFGAVNPMNCMRKSMPPRVIWVSMFRYFNLRNSSTAAPYLVLLSLQGAPFCIGAGC